MTMHRADLQNVLVQHSNSRIHLSHRLVSLEEGEGSEIVLHFKNGKTATCDFVVGMDGIKSAVRKHLLIKRGLPNSPSMDPICSGHMAYRALIPAEVLHKRFPGHRALNGFMMVCDAYRTQ